LSEHAIVLLFDDDVSELLLEDRSGYRDIGGKC